MDGADALRLHPSPDFVSDHIRRTGDYYERAILDAIRARIGGGVLVDVGAMIGNHTAYLARFVPHSVIHAFEPLVANRELLVDNVAGWPSVVVHPIALSDRPGFARMTVARDNLGHAAIASHGVSVATATLDSFGLEDVALLKVDVEGHEHRVIAGARDTIARCRPLIVIEDWSGPPAIPGYRISAEWERAHQTFMLEPIPT